jgi:hypothetical protein
VLPLTFMGLVSVVGFRAVGFWAGGGIWALKSGGS